MSFQVEMLEKNMAKLTIEASAERFEKALDTAYNKKKGQMNIQGFRKGKAPRTIIEKMYGVGVFYEDAANDIIPGAYEEAAVESGLDIVARPDIDVVQIEKGKAFIFTATVVLKPEVTLGDYKGLTAEKEAIEVTEEEIMASIEREREQNSRMITVEDRPVANGDIAVIDYDGYVDGKQFEGGKGVDYSLNIGSHSFIDTFEDQLIGKNLGDDVEVNVTFPAEYHAKDLAGKPALFKVKIKEIKLKELPELNDDFAQDVSEFETLADYKESIKANLLVNKEKEAKSKKENTLVEKAVANATMDIPEQMIDNQVSQMAEEFAQRMQYQGLSLEQYFQYTGMDSKKFMENLRPQAVQRIQTRLVLEAIVKAESIAASEEEVESELEKMASMYQMEFEKLKEIIGEREKEQISSDIAVQKAVDFIVDNAVEE